MNSQQLEIEVSLLPLRAAVIKGKYRMCVSDPVQAFFRVLTGGRVEEGWGVKSKRRKLLKRFQMVPGKERESFIFTYSILMEGSD